MVMTRPPQDVGQIVTRTDIDESQISLKHSNRLLVYNGGYFKTRVNNPNTTKFGNRADHILYLWPCKNSATTILHLMNQNGKMN